MLFGEQTLIAGDCLELMGQTPPESFDVVVTSPPYNLGIEYGIYKDDLPRAEYLAWMGKVCQAVRRVMADEGSFFLNVGFTNRNPWIAMDVAQVARDSFVLQNHIAWVKSVYANGTTCGHFKPVRSERFINNAFEHVFHFTKHGNVKVDRLANGVPYTAKINVEKWGEGRDLRDRGNVWHVPYDSNVQEPVTGLQPDCEGVGEWITVSEAAQRAGVNKAIITMAVNEGRLNSNGKVRRDRLIDAEDFLRWLERRAEPKKVDHPAIFPWKLAEMCIKLHGVKEGLRVLDPFAGLGSTLLATKNLGLSGVGLEINPAYVAMAQARINVFKPSI
jgi:excisionase family DNA binding protein